MAQTARLSREGRRPARRASDRRFSAQQGGSLVLVALAWAVLGWLAGTCVSLGTKRLLAHDGPNAAPRQSVLPGPLGLDPPLQLSAALAFGLLGWRLDFGLGLVIYSLYAAALLALLFTDLRTNHVYDVMVYPALGAAVVLTPVASGGVFWQGLGGGLIGGGCFGAIYLIGRLLYRGRTPMGAGDISLAALMGATLGYEQALAGVFLASLLGAALAVGYWVRFRSLKARMPYGPSLCLAALGLIAFQPPPLM